MELRDLFETWIDFRVDVRPTSSVTRAVNGAFLISLPVVWALETAAA